MTTGHLLLRTMHIVMGLPSGVRRSGVLTIPVLLVIGAFVYWLIRLRLLPRIRRARTPGVVLPLPGL